MALKMPIKFANGTTIGPVTIVCSTVLFLAMIASFIVLALYGNANNVATFIRPLIPTLATIGSALLIYVKTHNVQNTTVQQGQAAAATAADAKVAATDAKSAVDHVSQQVTDTQAKLNGELDARIQSAVTAALESKTILPAASVVLPPSTLPPTHTKGI